MPIPDSLALIRATARNGLLAWNIILDILGIFPHRSAALLTEGRLPEAFGWRSRLEAAGRRCGLSRLGGRRRAIPGLRSVRRPRASLASSHSGGVGAPPGVTTHPCQELADVWADCGAQAPPRDPDESAARRRSWVRPWRGRGGAPRGERPTLLGASRLARRDWLSASRRSATPQPWLRGKGIGKTRAHPRRENAGVRPRSQKSPQTARF